MCLPASFQVHNLTTMKTIYIFVLLLTSINCLAQVSVSSSDGNIEAVAFDNDKTDIFYIVRKNNKVLNKTRTELEKELTLEVQQSGNNLSIVVSFRLQLPRETACTLRTSDGNIAVKGFSRDQRCNTSDGDVNISDVRGSV